MERPVNVVQRFKKAIDSNLFLMHEELEMIELLVNKYNFISVSQYARNHKISQPGALKRVESGNVMYIEMIGKKFIIDV